MKCNHKKCCNFQIFCLCESHYLSCWGLIFEGHFLLFWVSISGCHSGSILGCHFLSFWVFVLVCHFLSFWVSMLGDHFLSFSVSILGGSLPFFLELGQRCHFLCMHQIRLSFPHWGQARLDQAWLGPARPGLTGPRGAHTGPGGAHSDSRGLPHTMT